MRRATPPQPPRPPTLPGLVAVVASLVGALTLGACFGRSLSSADMPPELARWFVTCDVYEDDLWESCAVRVLEGLSVKGVTGQQAQGVCEKLTVPEWYDVCAETAMVIRLQPASGDLCDRVTSDMIRQSCRLGAADNVTGYVPLPDAIEACSRTGSLIDHCLSHLAEFREDHWRAIGPSRASLEVQAVIAAFPDSVDTEPFGSSVGGTCRKLGYLPGTGSPCDVFPHQSEGWGACRRRFLAEAGWGDSSTTTGLSVPRTHHYVR